MRFCHFIKICLFLLLFVIYGSGSAQTYNFKNYNTDHGLPQSQVLTVFNDSKGYIWFGTNSGGVSRFDGNRFYNLNSNDGLVNDVVFAIAEDAQGKIYFGTSDGLSIYNNIIFKNYNEANGLNSTTIYSLLFEEGIMWIGTQQGLYQFIDGQINQYKTNSDLDNSTVYKIYKDKNGNLWFATFQHGVVLLDRKNNTFTTFSEKDGLMSNFILSLSEMDNGDVLVGTQTGLNIISTEKNVREASEIESNENNSYASILPLGDNIFMFSTFSDGVFTFDFRSKKRSKFYSSKNGLTNNSILSLIKDREGNIWMGSDGAGVFKHINHKFIYYTRKNGLPDDYINSVSLDAEGNIWIAMNSNGVAKITDGKIDLLSNDYNKLGLTDKNVNTIFSTPDGKVYFGTNEGLCYYFNNKINVVNDPLIRKKYISCLYYCESTLWIGTSEGVFVLNNGIIKQVSEMNKFADAGSNLLILFIIQDKLGRKLFGTENGIIILDENNISRINEKNNFVKSRASCAIMDSRKNLWIGTAEGLFLYDYKTFSKISKKHGYTSGFINFLQFDNVSNMYIGSNNGIDIIDTREFYQGGKTIKHLGKDDGLINLESNHNASTIGADGRVYIGTIKGLQIYNPKLDFINKEEPKLFITDLKLFYGQEEIVGYSKEIDTLTLLPINLVLPYNKNNLTFSFIGISLVAPEKVRYRYKLAGLDDNWAPEVSKTEVTYPSLPPGTYTFMVKAMNNDGVWNKEPATFVFEILPPWYKTTWFYALCFLVLTSGIISYNYLKTKKLKADKQKLERIVTERTSELRAEKEKVEYINKEVIQQKAEIENKNHEITDSIKYAKNIQEALLPGLVETEKELGESFILYLPKDIVSGDFFWFAKQVDKVFVAAADCTGHGVPGAFMSIIGNNLLNEIINVKKIVNPGDVLLELHKGVKKALNQNESDNSRRDGMDIALCSIENKGQTITFSGANRPLWIFRKNSNELEVIKPNKFPIGGLELEENRVYQSQSVSLTKGDCIYLFSDGFADQFGGPKGKKFMVSNMQKLIQLNVQLPMQEQKKQLLEAFRLWQNNLEQVDDVCVIGIRI